MGDETILRRLTKHIRHQNWFATGLDVLVVMIGVYMGIYLGGVQEERSFQREMKEALGALKSELSSDISRTEEIVEYQTWKISRTRLAMQLLDEKEFDGQAISALIRNTIGRNDTLFPHNAAYERLKEAGYLAALTEPNLRVQITDLFEWHYARQTVNANLYDKVMFEVTQSAVNPYWDIEGGDLINPEGNEKSIVKNGLYIVAGQGDFYTNYLKNTLLPELHKTLEMIKSTESTM